MTRKEKEKLYRLLKEKEIRKARENFYSFCQYIDPEFFTEGKPHLKLISDAFQDVADGKIKKLAISLPPRAGKSYTTSLFCAWIIGKYPKDGIMRNSYSAELAESFSYTIRELVQSEKYLAVFPHVELKKDRKNVSDWATTKAKQTTYFCAGVGGSITGKGASKLAILDDPIKNIEDALSDLIIEKTWNWYTSTHLSRMEKGCANIHIATRWSKKDPIGRLTDPYSPFYDPEFKVIVIPALNEEGKSFCEETKTTEEYLELKRITEDFIWESEFMQNPIEEKGLLFSVNELKRFSLSDIASKKPDGILGFTDTADKGEDYLCSLIGKKYGNYTYITDVIFTQEGVEITEPLVADMIINTKCYLMYIEANNGGYQYARNIRELIKGKSQCMVPSEQTTQNKETRILMNAGFIKEYFYFRNDYLPGSDYDKFMRQLTSYVKMGKNKHDDAPDAVTGLAERVRYMTFPAEKVKQHYNFDFERPKNDETDFSEVLGDNFNEDFFEYGG